MKEIEEIKKELECHGIRVSKRVKTERGLLRCLKAQKINLEMSITLLQAKLNEKQRKLRYIKKVIKELETSRRDGHD